MEPRAFMIVKNDRFELEPLERFGEVVHVFEGTNTSPFVPDDFFKRIEQRIKELQFDVTKDFIVLTGSALHLSLYLTKMVLLFPDKLRVLMFNANSSQYCVRVIHGNTN